MLTMALLVSVLVPDRVVLPRECALCGIYSGPNVAKVLDPYLRQVDIWPEFHASTCEFEVARGWFVRLDRTACSREFNYRLMRGVG
jgi:hypothetical protein